MTTEETQDFDNDHTQDVFDDNTENTETEVEAEAPAETPAETEAEEKTGVQTKTGEKEPSEETPAEENEDDEDNQEEKTVPVSRMKAALKDVTEDRDALRAKVSELTAKPAPDPDEDPDGYNFHLRMETSKAVMRDSVDDYEETIAHYQEMATATPSLNQMVAAHPAPAKHAYDLAKEDMKIREAREAHGSDEWKEFQAFKASKAAKAKEAQTDGVAENLAGDSKQSKSKEAPKVPNLNRGTDVSAVGKQPQVNDDEELFAGAL